MCVSNELEDALFRRTSHARKTSSFNRHPCCYELARARILTPRQRPRLCILFVVFTRTYDDRLPFAHSILRRLINQSCGNPLQRLWAVQPLAMPSATASGADATPNGSARSRDHNQGNQDRKYTVEQKTAVIRVRKCSATAFYEILGLEKTVSDAEIKKAYRKLSLLTHPDKNGYDGADEAFKSGLILSKVAA